MSMSTTKDVQYIGGLMTLSCNFSYTSEVFLRFKVSMIHGGGGGGTIMSTSGDVQHIPHVKEYSECTSGCSGCWNGTMIHVKDKYIGVCSVQQGLLYKINDFYQ